MRQLVSQREHLCRLEVSAIHKDDRGIVVDERKTLKFFPVELAVGIVPHDAVEDHQHTRNFDAVAQTAERSGPTGFARSPVGSKPERSAHSLRHLPGGGVRFTGTNEVQSVRTHIR